MDMNYWSRVLEEVLNKHNPNYPAILTNAREAFALPEPKPLRPPKVTKLHAKKRLARAAMQEKAGKKYGLVGKFSDIYLTKREAQVAYCFIQGKSTMQTAKLLNLSRRTVEFYVNNMKVKLNCRFKADLLDILLQDDFLDLGSLALGVPFE